MKKKVRFVPQALLSVGIVAASAVALFSDESASLDEANRRTLAVHESLRDNALHEAALSTAALHQVLSPEVRQMARDSLQQSAAHDIRSEVLSQAYVPDAERALRATQGNVDDQYLNVLALLHEQRAEICATAAAESWDPSIRGMVDADARLVASDLVRIRQLAAARR